MSAFDPKRTLADCGDPIDNATVSPVIGGSLIVFIGGGLGAALRHGVNRASLAYFGPGFPYGTLFVNIVGGLLMGVIAELFLAKGGGSQEFRLFLTTGLLGGFTTFSAFSLEAALMWQRSDYAALPHTLLPRFC